MTQPKSRQSPFFLPSKLRTALLPAQAAEPGDLPYRDAPAGDAHRRRCRHRRWERPRRRRPRGKHALAIAQGISGRLRRRPPARKGNISTSPQPPSPAGTSPNKLTSTSSDARSHTRCLPLNRAGDVVLRVKFACGACCRTLALEIGKLPSPAGIAHDKHRYTSPSVVYKLLPDRRPRSRSRTVPCSSRMNAPCSSQETSVLFSGTK